jgi:hypothetical protein
MFYVSYLQFVVPAPKRFIQTGRSGGSFLFSYPVVDSISLKDNIFFLAHSPFLSPRLPHPPKKISKFRD